LSDSRRRLLENTAKDLRACVDQINDRLDNVQDIEARLRLILTCRLLLEAAGFRVVVSHWPE
jgi:hypothetical protein